MPDALYYGNNLDGMLKQDYLQAQVATQIGCIGSQACFHTPTATDGSLLLHNHACHAGPGYWRIFPFVTVVP